jgi:CRP-like cAMP-binding protein
MYVLLSGDIEITRGETVLRRYSPGEYFGEVGCLSNLARSADCSSVHGARLIRVPKKVVKEVLGEKVPCARQASLVALESSVLFSGWSHQHLLGLLPHCKDLSPRVGTYLYKRGDTDAMVYIIEKGVVELLVCGEGIMREHSNKGGLLRKKTAKPERAIWRLCAGQHFGDEDGYDPQSSRWLSAKVLESGTRIYALPKSKLLLNVPPGKDSALKELSSSRRKLYLDQCTHQQATITQQQHDSENKENNAFMNTGLYKDSIQGVIATTAKRIGYFLAKGANTSDGLLWDRKEEKGVLGEGVLMKKKSRVIIMKDIMQPPLQQPSGRDNSRNKEPLPEESRRDRIISSLRMLRKMRTSRTDSACNQISDISRSVSCKIKPANESAEDGYLFRRLPSNKVQPRINTINSALPSLDTTMLDETTMPLSVVNTQGGTPQARPSVSLKFSKRLILRAARKNEELNSNITTDRTLIDALEKTSCHKPSPSHLAQGTVNPQICMDPILTSPKNMLVNFPKHHHHRKNNSTSAEDYYSINSLVNRRKFSFIPRANISIEQPHQHAHSKSNANGHSFL